ncbi:MAG TPA: 2-oxoglutarate dehydrogenase E1 component, partial [Azoarcus taiwanensis]|nr:2-oxoglutarate dehydrogenase E1 component [Azoarcus taiwanensis]
MMQEKRNTSHLFGSNAPFVEELYENYLADPNSVDEKWREYFDRLQAQAGAAVRDVAHSPVIEAFAQMARQGRARSVVQGEPDKGQVSTLQLINAYRFLGNRWANLDPLKRTERPE